MIKLDTLYNDISDNNIYVFDERIPNYKAATIRYKDVYGIFVDYHKIETLHEEFEAVAHEYGHCMTGTTHKIGASLETVARHEYRANKYAIENFCPYSLLLEAQDYGCSELWEFSEYLDLPESFIKKAFEYYNSKAII